MDVSLFLGGFIDFLGYIFIGFGILFVYLVATPFEYTRWFYKFVKGDDVQ